MFVVTRTLSASSLVMQRASTCVELFPERLFNRSYFIPSDNRQAPRDMCVTSLRRKNLMVNEWIDLASVACFASLMAYPQPNVIEFGLDDTFMAMAILNLALCDKSDDLPCFNFKVYASCSIASGAGTSFVSCLWDKPMPNGGLSCRPPVWSGRNKPGGLANSVISGGQPMCSHPFLASVACNMDSMLPISFGNYVGSTAVRSDCNARIAAPTDHADQSQWIHAFSVSVLSTCDLSCFRICGGPNVSKSRWTLGRVILQVLSLNVWTLIKRQGVCGQVQASLCGAASVSKPMLCVTEGLRYLSELLASKTPKSLFESSRNLALRDLAVSVRSSFYNQLHNHAHFLPTQIMQTMVWTASALTPVQSLLRVRMMSALWASREHRTKPGHPS